MYMRRKTPFKCKDFHKTVLQELEPYTIPT